MVQTPLRPQQPPLFAIPPLENGDRLSRDEFERRYAVMPKSCNAQLIAGAVYISTSIRFRSHAKPHSQLNGWLCNYQIFTPGVEVGTSITVRLDEENEPQPDIILRIEAPGGQTTISDDDYIEGAPELLAEISASTVSIDLGAKKTVYQSNGVQEYIVWRVLDGAIDWFYLDHGTYVDLRPDDDGIIRSRQFPGLWLDRTALLNGDMPQVITVLQAGLASDAHQTFCESLKS
jgi:hypothetical protein